MLIEQGRSSIIVLLTISIIFYRLQFDFVVICFESIIRSSYKQRSSAELQLWNYGKNCVLFFGEIVFGKIQKALVKTFNKN